MKEKRSRIKPLLSRLHKEFNVSVAEVDYQDVWQDALLACAWVGSDAGQVQRSLQAVITWVENNWPDVEVTDDQMEML